MRREISMILLVMLFAMTSHAQYRDHRGRGVDSLEVVASRWTDEVVHGATQEEAREIAGVWDDLMNGFLQLNPQKSYYYASRLLEMSLERGFHYKAKLASQVLGQHYWAQEKLDSAMVYYNMAAQAVDRMSRSGSGDGETSGYDPKTIDDARSQLYGALGNLHSTRGDLDSAMVYYNMALDIFQSHGWDTSCAVAYYNMGETYLEAGRQEDAEDCYLKSLDYGRKVQDSLWIATPLKGLGALYLEKGKTRKALSLLNEADSYFALHDDQEYVFRLETLGLMDKALELENRQQRWVIESMTAALILLVVSVGLFHRWKKTKSRLNEAEAFLEETIDEISQSSASKDSSEARLETSERKQQPTIRLSERELQILRLIADGKTNPQIAELIFLSPETVKWYRKKLLAKFEASNAADMVRKALEGGFLDQDGGK